mgnify:CR=1 FL=1
MLGTIVNILAVLGGSSLGLMLRRGIPDKIKHIVVQSIGLATIGLGISMIKMKNPIGLILGLLIGAVTGEIFNLEAKFNNFAELIKERIHSEDPIVEGMLTAFITFCVGPLTIIGSIEDGLGNPSILFTKSVLDGFMAIAYSSSLGLGVAFSTIPMLIYQGSLVLFASLIKGYLAEEILNSLTTTGGVLLLGLGIDLLRIKKIKVMNMLPALLIVPLIVSLM